MLWFYSRESQALRVETRYDNERSHYVLVVYWPDGRTQTERFTDPVAFRDRLVELETELGADCWKSVGFPVILPHGWPDKRLT